jgi:hypothetical protein
MKREFCFEALGGIHVSRITFHVRFQKALKSRTRQQHWIIAPHCLYRNLAPQQIHPAIRKFFALLRLHGLDLARIAIKKNARVIFARLERKSTAVFAKARVSLDELLITHSQKSRERRHFRVGKPHLTRPAATCRAALALEVDFHAGSISS